MMNQAEYLQMLRLADSLIAERRWGKAIGCLTKILCRRLRDVPAAVRRMKIYVEVGEYGAAVSDASNVLRWSPGEPQALRTRGMLRLLAENYDGAVEDLRAAIDHDPNDRELLNAWVHGKTKQAEAAYYKAAAAAAATEGKEMGGASWWHSGSAPAETAMPVPVRAVVNTAFVIAMDPAAFPLGLRANLQVSFDRPETAKAAADSKGSADAVGGTGMDAGAK
jgi:tetratricopeptide (TPR) repeat protein